MADIINFPTKTEAVQLREDMRKLEEEIKVQLDLLQDINDRVVDLTVDYEDMLARLCKITGVHLPPELDFEPDFDI
jgi:uncharacterized coiled-coil protein SlyX